MEMPLTQPKFALSAQSISPMTSWGFTGGEYLDDKAGKPAEDRLDTLEKGMILIRIEELSSEEGTDPDSPVKGVL